MYNEKVVVVGGVPGNCGFNKPFARVHVEALSLVMQKGLELSMDFHTLAQREGVSGSTTAHCLKCTAPMPLETAEEPCTHNIPWSP
jgi:hypothetical protein